MHTCFRIAVLTLLVLRSALARDASEYFEVYCDGVQFFPTKNDVTPQMTLFLYTGLPGAYIPKGAWKDADVYRDGCFAGQNCEVIARGKVRLDDELSPSSKHISGTYKVRLGGQLLQGHFTGQRRPAKHPRLCE